MAFLPVVLSVLGTVVSAAGSIAQGQAQAQAADYNAKVAQQQATQARDAANTEAQDYTRGQMRQVHSAQAGRAATGVTMAGSPLLVDEATVREVALGASRLKYKGAVEGQRLDEQAQLYKMQGSAAQTASYFGAGASILNGMSSWAQSNRYGNQYGGYGGSGAGVSGGYGGSF